MHGTRSRDSLRLNAKTLTCFLCVDIHACIHMLSAGSARLCRPHRPMQRRISTLLPKARGGTRNVQIADKWIYMKLYVTGRARLTAQGR